MRHVIAFIALSISALAQGGMMPGPGTVHSVAGVASFGTVTHRTQAFSGSGCVNGTGVCTVTVPSTTAGHLLVVVGNGTSNTTVASIGSGGGTGDGLSSTWTICGTNCIANDATYGAVSVAYKLVATGGATTITVNFSASGASFYIAEIYELAYTGTATLATSGHGTDTTNTSLAGQALTLTGGTTYAVFQFIASDNTTGIGGAYTASWLSGWLTAYALNTVVGTAPTWTASPTTTAAVGAIAFAIN